MKIDIGNMGEEGWRLLRDQKKVLVWLLDGQLPDGYYDGVEIESKDVGCSRQLLCGE
jgi:hypothetical protein